VGFIKAWGGKCVVSFADGAGDYRKKLQRLEQSLKGNFDGDFIGFTDYKQIGSPKHSEIPYAFKPYAIQKAIDLGYDQILWCDSPIVAKKSIEPVFDHIAKHGYLFFDNIGHSLGMWTNQRALDHFKMTRQQAMNIPMIMACCMGFTKGLLSGFYEYKSLAVSLYPGSWEDHRHDQTVMSFIIHQRGSTILKGQDTFFAYSNHRGVLPIADSVCLFSE